MNFHVKKCLQHSKDVAHFSRIRNRLWFIIDELSKERKRQNEEYVARRRQQMNFVLASLFNESESDW